LICEIAVLRIGSDILWIHDARHESIFFYKITVTIQHVYKRRVMINMAYKKRINTDSVGTEYEDTFSIEKRTQQFIDAFDKLGESAKLPKPNILDYVNDIYDDGHLVNSELYWAADNTRGMFRTIVMSKAFEEELQKLVFLKAVVLLMMKYQIVIGRKNGLIKMILTAQNSLILMVGVVSINLPKNIKPSFLKGQMPNSLQKI
jgi:hypothetical protein